MSIRVAGAKKKLKAGGDPENAGASGEILEMV